MQWGFDVGVGLDVGDEEKSSLGGEEKSRLGGKDTLGFLLLAKAVAGEGLGDAERFWNCASCSSKIFKTLLLPAFPRGGQRGKKLPPPALVLLKKLQLLGGAARKHCRYQTALTDSRLKVSRTEKCFRGAGMELGTGGAWH